MKWVALSNGTILNMDVIDALHHREARDGTFRIHVQVNGKDLTPVTVRGTWENSYDAWAALVTLTNAYWHYDHESKEWLTGSAGLVVD